MRDGVATDGVAVLHAAVGRTPHTAALRIGAVSSPRLRVNFVDVSPISRAFAPMVREARFDVSEMAIATFLMARSLGKPLVLLPVVLAARFQEGALLCRADSGLHGPSDLRGRCVGVRAYSQTTGMWLRGILAESHGVRAQDVRWVTLEDAHVAEYRDPAWVERAPSGSDLLHMLRAGILDAVIVGSEVPDDPGLRTVFPNPAAAGEAFRRRHGFTPVNHLLTVWRALADTRPDLVRELLRLFRQAGAAVSSPAALQPTMDLALRWSSEQGLLATPLRPHEVWDGLPEALPSDLEHAP